MRADEPGWRQHRSLSRPASAVQSVVRLRAWGAPAAARQGAATAGGGHGSCRQARAAGPGQPQAGRRPARWAAGDQVRGQVSRNHCSRQPAPEALTRLRAPRQGGWMHSGVRVWGSGASAQVHLPARARDADQIPGAQQPASPCEVSGFRGTGTRPAPASPCLRR